MKFSFYTLGCKVNQYETQAMQQMLLSHGHTLGEFDEPCDGYIVNSCTVTAVSSFDINFNLINKHSNLILSVKYGWMGDEKKIPSGKARDFCQMLCFNPQSVISQSLTYHQRVDCGLPRVSGGYRFLSARR